MINILYFLAGFTTGQLVFAIIETMFEIRNVSKDNIELIKLLTKSIEATNQGFEDRL